LIQESLSAGTMPAQAPSVVGVSVVDTPCSPEIRNMPAITMLAKILLIIGGLNWTFVGLAHVDLVAALTGQMTIACRAVYTLFGIAALWLSTVMMSNRLLGPIVAGTDDP
jgi:uncharacterized membrane protein YuzA (DUF378 family)